MHILLTNDDGIEAAGIRTLCAQLSCKHRVTIVAPDSEQSGIGHAFTYHTPVYYEKKTLDFCTEAYAVSGTPSDCVKVGISIILSEQPDAVVSGMNIGENSGVSGFYSGTVAGAREGAFWRVPSYAFSVCDNGGVFLELYAQKAAELFDKMNSLRSGSSQALSKRVFINVNFPGCHPRENRGVRITRQSMAYFNDKYKAQEQADGRTGYVIYGEKHELEESNGYDSRALENGYTTVTPLHFDATAEQALGNLSILEHPAG